MEKSYLNEKAGEYVKKLRGSRTQSQMASAANVQQGQWSKLEKGIVPRPETLKRIAESLEVTIENILSGGELRHVEPEAKENEEGYSPNHSHVTIIRRSASDEAWELLDHFETMTTENKNALLTLARAITGKQPEGK